MGNILLKQNQIFFKFSDRATSPVVKEINICGKMSKTSLVYFAYFASLKIVVVNYGVGCKVWLERQTGT